jgi:hypothetical protein
MDPKNKFATDTVRQLQQSLDDVAPYQATELSKQQTIRALSPQILALRAKGYSWMAVASMLSERGLPVSVAALRTYLRRIREEAATDAPPTAAKRSRDRPADTRQPGRVPPSEPLPSQSRETSSASNPQQPGGPPAPTVSAPRAGAGQARRELEPRRSTFAVRPDREDI